MRRGFTIIEVLAALLIFAFSAVALTSGYINVLNAYDHVRSELQEDEDLQLARAALFSQPDLTLATQGDDFDVVDGKNSRHIVWLSDIEPTNVADLFEVTLTCSVTPQSGKTTTSSEVIRLLRPTWSDPTQRTSLQMAAQQKIKDIIAANQPPTPR